MTKQGPHGIAWCDWTANPIRYRDASGKEVWHCEKVSAGCTHCYAEALAKRMHRGGPFGAHITPTVTPFFDEREARALLTSTAIAGKRVFIGDMTDVFGEWVSDALLDKLFAVFALRPDVTFQVLTKRPARMRDYITAGFVSNRVLSAMEVLTPDRGVWSWPTWDEAMRRVWLGTSVEDQAAANERIPELLRTPAAVRFISAEPLLGPVDLRHYIDLDGTNAGADFREKNGWGYDDWSGGFIGPNTHGDSTYAPEPGIHWVIVGGESGAGARACHANWVQSLAEQCAAAEVACFVKQLGPWLSVTSETPTAPGVRPLVTRHRLRDRKGGDPNQWPAALRVRQFPEAVR